MSTISLIFLIIIFLLLIFIAYRLYIYQKGLPINVYINENSQIKTLIDSIECLKKPYHPTPWLFNCHIQTLYSMQLRKRSNFENERENVTFPDGGIAIIDWFHPTTIETARDENSFYEKKDDIIIIFHTLGGSSREKVVHSFGVSCANKGFTACVLNCRGCGGAKFLNEKAYNAYEIDDFKFSIDNYVKKRNPRHLFICGFSMGSMHATRYSIDYPDDITAVLAVSHPMDAVKSAHQLESFPLSLLYLPKIMESHHRLYKKMPFIDNPAIEKAKNLTELDTVYTAPSLGMKSCYELWEKLSIYDKIDKIKVPLIHLIAEDDPFSNKSYFPFVEMQKDSNKFMALVTTKEGGHCGFIEGFNGEHSLVEDIAFEWFEKAAQVNMNVFELI